MVIKSFKISIIGHCFVSNKNRKDGFYEKRELKNKKPANKLAGFCTCL